jgi:predicted kinase
MLIVFGGLPGVGKTTLSRRVAARLCAVWLRIDAIEEAMWRGGADRAQTGLAAYVVADAVADANLSLGLSVVVDAVNPVEEARQGWRDLGAKHGIVPIFFEVVCSDPVEHRRRVEHRTTDLATLTLPTWNDVVDHDYRPWRGEHHVVDTAGPDDGGAIAKIFALVGAR